jgi:RNA-directed DNA polymerase
LHYAFDAWVRKKLSNIQFCRYADDGLLHCSTKKQAEDVLKLIEQRFLECGLTLHPEKSGVIYCKDIDRKEEFERISFDFLGYTFRPRRCINKRYTVHSNFLPAISDQSKKAIMREMRSWHIQLESDKSLNELSEQIDVKIRGWYEYYGKFYPSAMICIWRHLNYHLTQWVKRKYKRFAKSKIRAREHLNRVAIANPNQFMHWKLGVLPKYKDSGSRMS